MNNSVDVYSMKTTLGYSSTPRIEVIQFLPREAGHILEVGCGEGATLELLKNMGYANWTGGVDISEAAISSACKKNIDYLSVANLDKDVLDIPIESIDTLLLLDVLEHLVNPWEVLLSLKRLLKPGGTVIITLPNVRSLRVLLPLFFLGKWRYKDSGILDITHLRFFTKKSSIELLESAGFELDKIRPLPDYHKMPNLINKITVGIFSDFLVPQYILKGTVR